MITNFICRLIGLITTIYSLKFAQGLNESGFPFTLLAWGIALFALIVFCVVLKILISKQSKKIN